MRPHHTWIIAGFCLALLCGAMAWTTRSMLGMERDQNRMAAEATVQELARLALWRMESIASALVIEESARPPEHYRSFSEPEALLDNKTYTSVSKGALVSLSPLLREPPDDVLLHFEMDASGALKSPQVPVGRERLVCEQIGVPPAEMMAGCNTQLAALRGLMDRKDSSAKLDSLRAGLPVPPALWGNRAFVWSLNETVIPDSGELADKAQAPAPLPNEGQQTVRSAQVQQSANWKPDQVRAQQSEFNADEAQARAEIVGSAKGKTAQKLANSLNLEELNKRTVSRSKSDATPAAINSESVTPQELLPPPAPANPPASAPLAPVSVPSTPAQPATTSAAAPATPAPAATPVVLSDFRPFWMADALILTRRVASGGREWIQGAWLDWNKLRGEMLAAVQDRFPLAQIVPAPDNPAPGAHLLASLPVQLIPGDVAFAAVPFWTPLKVSLGIAWLCVLLAVAAVALVLRGMMALSERRASFVSSVTHELRTPLATFKLYSEMLADGMVREESKKQQYLETLTGEADRLGHLVENVLAYSRIERGKGPAAAAAVPVRDLVRRIEPQLNQRALMAGMDFSVTVPDDVMALALRTDGGAVGQILCNLVDNACKYGRREDVPGKVELVLTKERRRVCLAVRDHGPGIPPGEERQLFLPFHKSARDAAHSKPGVGLGLALCRRMAAELRGTLEIDRAWRHGASFVLTLPV